MKTNHKWKETIYEKLMCIDNAQSSDHSAKPLVEPINFYCAAPDAESVQIVGDFNNWHPSRMQRSLAGWWHIRLHLCHGQHQYRFVVDGVPKLDPYASGIVYDIHLEEASLIGVS